MAPPNNVSVNNFLTDYVRGLHFGGHIVDDVFPDIIAQNLEGMFWDRGGIEFDVENIGPFALGQPYQGIEWQIDKQAFEIQNFGLFTTVDNLEQDGTARPHIDLAREKLNLGMSRLMTQRELAGKNIFEGKPGGSGDIGDNYPTNHYIDVTKNHPGFGGTPGSWSAEATDPRKIIHYAANLISRKIGRYPNTAIFGRDAFTALRTNKAMLASFQNVISGTLTPQMVAVRFDLDVGMMYRPEALYNSAERGQPRLLEDIWPSDAVWLFYKDEAGRSSMEPKSGFTGCFKLSGWEMERVTEWPTGNPPGMLYCVQNPYKLKALDYNACVMLDKVV